MTQAQFLADAGQRLINGVFIVSVLFPVVTTFFWAWWRSEWGWNIILLEACIAATLLPTVLLIDFGIDDIPLRCIDQDAVLCPQHARHLNRLLKHAGIPPKT